MDISLPETLSTCSTACFTGPRPKDLYGYDDESAYGPILNYLVDVLSALVPQGIARFISGGAQGFDQLAFDAVELLKRRDGWYLSNDVYVPFPAQPRMWSRNGMFGQDAYRGRLSRANNVTVLSDDPGRDKPYLAARKLHDRNHSMVDDSDIVVALLVVGHNDDWADAKGGTAECVRYAISAGKPVLAIVLDKSDGSFSHKWL